MGANFQYEYGIQDHLGNTRLTFADLNANGIVDVPGDILQENHYYPFGMNMNYSWMNNVALDNRYQYNGKELNDDFGLNWNDYGARWYDASIGRFPSVDPIIEKFPYLTPYNYASNSPVSKIDLWGLQGGFVHDLKKGAESGFGSLVGALTAMAEDITGADLPSPDNTSSFGQGFATGEMLGHLGMMVTGAGEFTVGGIAMDAGTTAIATGGLAPEGALVVAGGALLTAHGPFVVSNAIENLTEGTRNMNTVPNPNGKNGGPDHQAKVNESEQELKDQGYSETSREVHVKTPGGNKSSRFIDVQGKNPNTGDVKQVQVGKQNKDGSPVSRERKALDDVQNATGKRPDFKPYNQ